GGGINVASTFVNALSLTNLASIVDNSASRNGGGVNLAGGASSSFTTPTIQRNHADSGLGGGINVDATFVNTLTLDGTLIGGSSANKNTAQNGGGIAFAGTNLKLKNNATVSFNTASQKGGGLHQSAGTVNIDPSHIDNNTAANDGGGINITGGTNHQITASTVSANTASNGSGGGINLTSAFASTLTLDGATI